MLLECLCAGMCWLLGRPSVLGGGESPWQSLGTSVEIITQPLASRDVDPGTQSSGCQEPLVRVITESQNRAGRLDWSCSQCQQSAEEEHSSSPPEEQSSGSAQLLPLLPFLSRCLYLHVRSLRSCHQKAGGLAEHARRQSPPRGLQRCPRPYSPGPKRLRCSVGRFARVL